MGKQDVRDESTWVVYELTHAGERLATDGTLDQHFRQALKLEKKHRVFVPYLPLKCDNKVTLYNVMQGYAFVGSGLDEREYLAVTRDSPYFRNVLHSKRGSMVVLHTITDTAVKELKRKLMEMVGSEIKPDIKVEIVHGTFQGLEGLVLDTSDKTAQVLIELRTLQTIRTIPRHALVPMEDK